MIEANRSNIPNKSFHPAGYGGFPGKAIVETIEFFRMETEMQEKVLPDLSSASARLCVLP